MRLKLSERSYRVLQTAYKLMQLYNNSEIGTEFILGAILKEEIITPVHEVFGKYHLAWPQYNEILGELNRVEPRLWEEQPDVEMEKVLQNLSRRTKGIFNSLAYQSRMGHLDIIEPEMLMLALLDNPDSLAMRIAFRNGIGPRVLQQQLLPPLRQAIKEMVEMDGNQARDAGFADEELGFKPHQDKSGTGTGTGKAKANAKGKQGSALLQYGTDLTERCLNQQVDPVIGRNKEIERVMQILCRRTKNNPCLVGEPGVGKTAISEGLAQMIINGQVPEILADKRVISLDMAGMLAGAKYRGEFEERMKNVLQEAKDQGNIILFIDELHTLVGAGSGDGAVDAANMMKPLLARGELQVIGATTLNEYRKYIEKDAALERRFQPVMVEEPSEEDSLAIMHGIRDKYEKHHHVQITDEALAAAVKLSVRYISDRFLPDKAIDLMDEAAAKLRLQTVDKAPTWLEEEKELKAVMAAKTEAATKEEFEEASVLRKKQEVLEARIQQLKEEWQERGGNHTPVLTEEGIAEVVSSWTGIPVRRLTEDDTQRLRQLEDELHKRVIGQDEAIKAVSQAIRRSRLGLKDPRRPVGSFLFLGTTGVGKTELAKSLAEVLFGDENAMIRIDMSEYMEKFDVNKLIGSPPGYVGYDEGGQLTEKVRRHPYSVVLFDEIEKAHPDVFNVLLQVLEDGRLTDGQGRTVHFANTVIIMTSNLGARLLLDEQKKSFGFSLHTDDDKKSSADLYGGRDYDEAREMIMKEVRQAFSPEFVNRIDEMIFFKMLDREAMLNIVSIMLRSLKSRVAELNLALTITRAAEDYLAELGYDPQYGARPLRRVIQHRVEDLFSQTLLDTQYKEGDVFVIDVEEREDGDKAFVISCCKKENDVVKREPTPIEHAQSSDVQSGDATSADTPSEHAKSE